MKILDRIKLEKIIPVIKLNEISRALPLMKALIDGGINCAEITYRTENAGAIIKIIKEQYGDSILVAAGTISSIAQAEDAVKMGADFLVSPGFNNQVVDYCIQHDILIIPGVSTCSEIENALNHGLDHLKFFPSEACGGIKFLKAIASPYSKVMFMPTGGITEDNLPEYKSLNNVFSCGGSFMVTEKLLNEENYDEITRICKNI